MRKFQRQFVVTLFWICSGLQAQDSLRIDLLAESFLKQTKLPGLSVAVAKNGNLIYAKGFGFSNLEEAKEMLTSSRIRTASIAKVLTATALGRLVTEGLLDFNAPIEKYVPYINTRYAALTVRQLAGHTSGLEHRPSAKGYKNKQYNSIKETLEIIDARLLFEPGTDYKYSTAAFNLLAAVIEGASGMTYPEYMKKHVFEPLGMNQTAPENIKELTKDDAEIYFFKNGKLKKDRLNNGSYKVPGAAFRSTPSDLVKLMNAYSENGFITEKVAEEMFTSNTLKNGKKTNVGIAWRTSIDIFGHQVIEHAGNWRGARTILVYYPEEQLSISLMINAECQILIEETAHIFAQLFREGKQATSSPEIEKELEVVHNSKEGQVRYNGKIELKTVDCLMTTESDNFLKSNEVIQLPDGFALSTFYGMLFLELDTAPKLRGKVYAYYSMNKKNPKDEKPLIEFEALR